MPAKAWDLWEAGQREAAVLAYEAELEAEDHAHWSRPDKLGQLACLLNQLGRCDEASLRLEQALEAALEQANGEDSDAVRLARYFLAEQRLKLGHPDEVPGLVEPTLAAIPEDWLLQLVLAKAQQALGRLDAARHTAAEVLRFAPNPRKREELRGLLAGLA